MRFERGFLHACELAHAVLARKPELMLHPLWSTVHEVDTRGMDFFVEAPLRSLRRATIDGATLSLLARKKHVSHLEAVIGRRENRRWRGGADAWDPTDQRFRQ